ncbi:unnamed protein product, partial [Meganyctiphanes norvegica]
FDEPTQDYFLNFVTKTLTHHEQQILETRVTINEIFRAIKDMNTNKSPGIDGIPIEFYLKYWDIIKIELYEIFLYIIDGLVPSENQRTAVLTLIPKEGDLNLLKTWRPVSLICCDIKIIAKILAKRIGPLLYSLLSENQHCILGKSIIDCNTKMRDIMFYTSKNNMTGAIINVDWEKAFDRVNWNFLFKIFKKMKFPDFVITWIKTLYTDVQSLVLINGHCSKKLMSIEGSGKDVLCLCFSLLFSKTHCTWL